MFEKWIQRSGPRIVQERNTAYHVIAKPAFYEIFNLAKGHHFRAVTRARLVQSLSYPSVLKKL